MGGAVTDIAPNSIVRVEVIETIHHVGAPYRIALSHVKNDSYSDCILLNHIPQHTLDVKATLFIDIEIPDVNCSMCALQIISFMTDKIGQGNTCQYLPDGKSGSCFSNYHSCANVRINGQLDREELTCQQPEGWPYKSLAWDMYTQEESAEHWTLLNNNPVQVLLITNGSNESYTSMPPTEPSDPGTSAAAKYQSLKFIFSAFLFFFAGLMYMHMRTFCVPDACFFSKLHHSLLG